MVRTWRRGGERIVFRGGLHKISLVADGRARVHVIFGVRGDPDGSDALARALMPDRAKAFFDLLPHHRDLRVRTFAWTSAAREAKAVSAAAPWLTKMTKLMRPPSSSHHRKEGSSE